MIILSITLLFGCVVGKIGKKGKGEKDGEDGDDRYYHLDCYSNSYNIYYDHDD